MRTKENNTKTLRFSEGTDEKHVKLAKKIGRGKQVFFEQIVEYFHRTKKDPCDSNNEARKITLMTSERHSAGWKKLYGVFRLI